VNKKMLALSAMMTACSFSTAHAVDIRLFGHVHADIRVNAPESHSTVNNNDSSLGFRASADFSGFKAYFQHVFLVDGLDGDSLLDENTASYFHLYGGNFFGSLKLGHQPTSAGVAYDFIGNNHLPDSIANFSDIGFTEYEATKTLVYQLPTYAGFTLAIGASASVNGDNTSKLFASPSIGLMYDEGHGLKLGFGYEIIDDRALGAIAQDLNDAQGFRIGPQSSDSKLLQLGGSYTFDNITVGAQFEQTQNLLPAESGVPSSYNIVPQDGIDRTSFGVSGKMTFGNSALSVNLGTEKVENSTDEANNHFASIALNHTINERVNTYIAFRNKNTDMTNMQRIIGSNQPKIIDGLVEQRTVAVGMQYQF
jgi:predicted porin